MTMQAAKVEQKEVEAEEEVEKGHQQERDHHRGDTTEIRGTSPTAQKEKMKREKKKSTSATKQQYIQQREMNIK